MALTAHGPKAYLFVWGLLSLPALGWCLSLAQQGAAMAPDALNPTGALSAILFIFTLLATPLRQLWPRGPAALWLVRHRRYLGVASFGYAVLHTLLYLLVTGSAAEVLAQFPKLDIWTGWASLLIMAPLALTSSDGWVRRLRHRWKTLQRWAYVAALLGLLHAASLNAWGNPWEALVVAAPLIALQVRRVHQNHIRRTTGWRNQP